MCGFQFIPDQLPPIALRQWVQVVALLAVCLLLVYPMECQAEQTDTSLTYNRDIRPILADKCFVCHGPDKGSRQAELRLDTAAGAYAALASDEELAAIRPGNRHLSAVFQRISERDADLRMPPADSNLKLSPEEIEIIGQWIDQGATYQPHWAFLAPQKASIPAISADAWSRSEIDAFVLERMKLHGLDPNPAASREHLLRRITFDLTGLPPTLDEIDAFIQDESPEAFERVVDRLLASEHFGERMASEWLDVARYSDTYGLQVDFDRFVWPWRDWVIRAFNMNLPYDQFLTQQLAGDLLPDASQEQILATTFCRLHPQEAEGGTIPEEFRVGYVADRVQTVSTAFLGLTLECAKCHDHKYDPLSQREYYQLFSFFDNIDESGRYSFFTGSIPSPTLLLADATAQQSMEDQQRKIEEQQRALVALRNEREGAFAAWLGGSPISPAKLPGEVAHLDFEMVNAPHQSVEGPSGHAVQLTGDDPIPLEVGNFHRYEPFSVSLWMQTPDIKERAVIFHRSRAWTDAGSRGYELLLLDGHLSAALVHFDPGNSLRVSMQEQFPVGSWHHVAMTYDGSSRASGLKLYVDGVPVPVEVVRDQLTKEITGGGNDNITIGERFRDHGFTDGKVDEFRVYAREITPLEVAQLHDGSSIANALQALSNAPVNESLFDFYLNTTDVEYQAGLVHLLQLRKEHAEFIESIPEIMAMREMAQPRQTYLLERGDYTARADKVESDTPTAFPPFPVAAPKNRLGLAQWMTSPDHPLTARVAVNRHWQMLFGAGLVRTTEDMGNQGEWPTHPELLDWLARDFIEHNWDVKRLLKQMILTSTYQQSAIVDAEKEILDPANRWLSRTMSERYTAEMLRDNALAVSGLLVDKIGGPPARPYEVEVSFKPLTRDQGDGLYRRSLYTFWNRTGPAPVMMALDAAKRDLCQVRRERTLSPLQSLVLLNGPQFVEAARFLAQRTLQQHPSDQTAVLVDMFRWTTSRRPTEEELNVLQQLFAQLHEEFSLHEDRAIEFLSVGDKPRDERINPVQLAAMAGVANMLLNYDECVFRR